MNIEYEVTVEDDLNAKYTDLVLWLKEGKIFFISARYFPFPICIMSVAFILWGCLTPEQSDRYTLFTGGVLCLLSSIFLFFTTYKPQQTIAFLNPRNIEKEHQKYSLQPEQRNMILTEEEFIFKTGDLEMSWSWQALKLFKEEEKGFKFYFYSGHQRFIPKKVFIDEQQSNTFKDLINHYQTIGNKDEK